MVNVHHHATGSVGKICHSTEFLGSFPVTGLCSSRHSQPFRTYPEGLQHESARGRHLPLNSIIKSKKFSLWWEGSHVSVTRIPGHSFEQIFPPTITMTTSHY